MADAGLRDVTPAQRWGHALARELARQGVTQLALAQGIYAQHQTVSNWVRGKTLPMHESAVLVGQFLDAPGLVRLSAELHTRSCAYCGTDFIYGGRQERVKYCSVRCASRGHKPSDVAYSESRRYARAKLNAERVKLYRETVDTFCRECEPEGLCRTPRCPIQVAGLSPLPVSVRQAI